MEGWEGWTDKNVAYFPAWYPLPTATAFVTNMCWENREMDVFK